jgi:GNAT superfamily N-acetyltransferase
VTTIQAPRVEQLGPDDHARLREIRLRSLRDAPDAFGSTFDETAARTVEDWRRQLADLATFVAVANEADVGLVRGAAHTDRPDAAMLLSMWVAPEARGAGIGVRLIDALIDWARAAHYDRLYLDVADDNRFAIALYARKGFTPTGATGALPPPRDHIREHERMRHL